MTTHLIPPESPQDTVVAWNDIEETLGTRLPDDYKRFICQYGTGKICDFMCVLNPVSPNPNLNLTHRIPVLLRALREYREMVKQLGTHHPLFAVFPETGGLLPWGTTDNGDVFYWRTTSPDPNTWPTVVNDSRGSMWEEYAGTMTEFIDALLSRRFSSEILTDDEFPPKEAFFHRA